MSGDAKYPLSEPGGMSSIEAIAMWPKPFLCNRFISGMSLSYLGIGFPRVPGWLPLVYVDDNNRHSDITRKAPPTCQ